MSSARPAASLEKLAAAAADHRPPTAGGRIHYIRTCGWYLASTQILTGESLQHVDSRMEAIERELWLDEDGSGRIEEYCDGVRTDQSGSYGARQLDVPLALHPPEGPPADLSDHRRLRCLADLWSARVVPARVQAEWLTAFASTLQSPTVAPVVDRLGRAGLAVAAEGEMSGRSCRYELVLSETSGQLLAAEDVVLEQAEWLPAPAPCTISYTAFITSRLVEEAGARRVGEAPVR